ncbi:MAG: branched-chain amino acid ABC transporter permease, partial [Alcaligenaceae bacterium]|nr:branched-chain amino acid ABC transporter permease [Alcaligenaceae bacterium]
LIFGVISELLRQVLSFQEIIYGLILIGFMMFAPRGLFSGQRRKPAVSGAEVETPAAGGRS